MLFICLTRRGFRDVLTNYLRQGWCQFLKVSSPDSKLEVESDQKGLVIFIKSPFKYWMNDLESVNFFSHPVYYWSKILFLNLIARINFKAKFFIKSLPKNVLYHTSQLISWRCNICQFLGPTKHSCWKTGSWYNKKSSFIE